MANTNRYEGLLFLREQQLPVPDFMKIESISQLEEDFFHQTAPYGWTIRTCKKNGKDEMSLFYKNKLDKKMLFNILQERLHTHGDEFYVVYPSWDFYFSFNMIKTDYQYFIEGTQGSQKALASGQESPTFSLSYHILNPTYTTNDPFLLDPTNKKMILQSIELLKRMKSIPRFYTEVAVTKQTEIYFYEFWDIDKLHAVSDAESYSISG